MTVAITRTEHTAVDLRRLAGGSDDAGRGSALAGAGADPGRPQARGGGAAGWDGPAASRDWVHRHNADGMPGVTDRHGGGVARRLSAEQEAEVAGWIRTGPDLAVDKVVPWRCADIQAQLAALFGVSQHERSVGKPGQALALPRLHRLRLSHISTRPQHPKADPVAQASFRAGSALL